MQITKLRTEIAFLTKVMFFCYYESKKREIVCLKFKLATFSKIHNNLPQKYIMTFLKKKQSRLYL